MHPIQQKYGCRADNVLEIELHLYSEVNIIYTMYYQRETVHVQTGEAFLAETLLRSPQKIFVFTIKKYTFRFEVTK